MKANMLPTRTYPKLRTETADFRTYEPITARDRFGREIEMTLCEELVAGRWEPFYSTRKQN